MLNVPFLPVSFLFTNWCQAFESQAQVLAFLKRLLPGQPEPVGKRSTRAMDYRCSKENSCSFWAHAVASQAKRDRGAFRLAGLMPKHSCGCSSPEVRQA